MEPLSLLTLIGMVRDRLDDHGKTRPRWSDSTITEALNEAEQEACERALLLRDEFTDALTKIDVVANTSTYLLASCLFRIDSIYNEVDGGLLTETSEQELYCRDPSWRTRTGSSTSQYVLQVLPSERMQLRLVPIPTADTTLRLQAYRYPRYPMTTGGDEPEISPRHHNGLVEWAVYKCFSIKDPDLYDPVKAGEAEAEFTRRFGPKIEANVRRKLRERRRNVVVARDF